MRMREHGDDAMRAARTLLRTKLYWKPKSGSKLYAPRGECNMPVQCAMIHVTRHPPPITELTYHNRSSRHSCHTNQSALSCSLTRWLGSAGEIPLVGTPVSRCCSSRRLCWLKSLRSARAERLASWSAPTSTCRRLARPTAKVPAGLLRPVRPGARRWGFCACRCQPGPRSARVIGVGGCHWSRAH